MFYFLDPDFPRRLQQHNSDMVAEFLQSLFEKYSTCGLSKPTDRPVALSGLMTRIELALSCEESYGVLGRLFHRTLLWSPTDTRKAKKIIYDKNTKIPSWSWMAYEGGIQFQRINYWNVFKKLQFGRGGMALVTDVWGFRGCRLQKDSQTESTTTRYSISNLSEQTMG